MSDPKLRRAIAARAAQLMYTRDESEYFTAKRKAARQFNADPRNPKDLPSNREVRDELQLLAALLEGEARGGTITAMRLEALRWMRRLERFKPRLIGSVYTGHVRRGSDIDLHVFTDSLEAVTLTLDEEHAGYTVERKRVVKHHETRVYRHVHVDGEFPVELTVYSAAEVHYPFRSSITGKPIEKTDAVGLEVLLRETNPGMDVDAELERGGDYADPFVLYELLLQPLADLKQPARWHPEGDALYHSLQVFELARAERAWDQELLLAALLHDVGKAIDPTDHVAAGVEALEGSVSERTLWLVEHHMAAHTIKDGTIGHRAKRRLRDHVDYEDLVLLGEWDRAGRVPGARVCTVGEALEFVRDVGQ